jgi:hypothetical protein
MSTTQNRRGRHKQAARNLMIAVATASLAGTGAAMAADGGGAPPNTKTGAGAAAPQTTKVAPGGAGSVNQGPKQGVRAPLADNEPIVTQARAALERLVADGSIEQAEADVVLRDVIAGSVDPVALVRAGEVSSAHMPAINDALIAVKRANAPAGG